MSTIAGGAAGLVLVLAGILAAVKRARRDTPSRRRRVQLHKVGPGLTAARPSVGVDDRTLTSVL